MPDGIDVEKVTGWLEAEIDGLKAPFEFSLIAGGRSNLTFRVTDAGGRQVVLRRPPLGAVLATAHDMAREHRIIAALGPTKVPVPPALGLCEDEDVNGAPFYVMDFVPGVVLGEVGSGEIAPPKYTHWRLHVTERPFKAKRLCEAVWPYSAVRPPSSQDLSMKPRGRRRVNRFPFNL